jgi:hypothetical protein
LTLLAAVFSCFGCGEETVEIPVTVRRSETTPCRATVNSEVRPMNTYWVDVFVFPGGTGDAGAETRCSDCSMSNRCALVSRQCRCGSERTLGTEELVKAISGVRFTDLSEDGGAYCVRVIALELSNPPCQCKLEDGLEPPPSPQSTQVRACAISTTPTSLAEGTSLSLELSCLDDNTLMESKLQQCISDIPLPPPIP